MDYMRNLKEKLCKELEEIAMKPEMGAGDLELVHKLTDTIKNIEKISMLDGDGGYSRDYSMGGDWETRGSYDRGSSYRGRKRDSMGRYSRDGYPHEGRYSREGANAQMMEELEALMDKAGSEKERQAIRRCMEHLENA